MQHIIITYYCIEQRRVNNSTIDVKLFRLHASHIIMTFITVTVDFQCSCALPGSSDLHPFKQSLPLLLLVLLLQRTPLRPSPPHPSPPPLLLPLLLSQCPSHEERQRLYAC